MLNATHFFVGASKSRKVNPHCQSILCRLAFESNTASSCIIKQIHAPLITGGTVMHSLPVLNNLLRCYSHSDAPHFSVVTYKQALEYSLPFNSFTYTFLINGSANFTNPIPTGAQFHGLTIKIGFGAHVYVQTALINLYCAGGSPDSAQHVFDDMPERNKVTWNSMITGFAKMGCINRALKLLDEMPEKNVVSFTGIVDGLVRMKRVYEGFSMFLRMSSCENIKPNDITVLAILPAISLAGDSIQCASLHCHAEKCGFLLSRTPVCNAIIDTYSKCGNIESALKLFDEMPPWKRNIVSWTSAISCLAMHGKGQEAVSMFQKMEQMGLKPNEVTFLSLMNACSHGGLVSEGIMFYEQMREAYKIECNIKHYGCIVDLLGREGRLKEAERIALEIPQETVNDVVWRTLLGACSIYGDAEIGERAARRIMEIERNHGGDYALMCNLLIANSKFEKAEELRTLMDRRNAHKLCGRSGV